MKKYILSRSIGCLAWLPISLLVSSTEPATAKLPPAAPTSVGVTQNLLPLAEGDDYILGAGDRLRLDLFGVPEFSGEYQILPNGTLNLSRVGAVSVQGLTLKQASATIGNRYRNYLTRPIATLSLLTGRPVNVAISGEINRPGSYTMNSAIVAANGEVPTLTRLLQVADGVTNAADLQQVKVRRKQPGGYQVYTLDLWQLVKAAESTQDIRLQDGDSIYIPETSQINLANARQLTSVNFATRSNRPLRIAVTGEVNRPGPYTIFEGNAAQTAQRNETPNATVPTVTQALQVAGGITQMADLRSIQVRRLTRSGNEQKVAVNFWELLSKGDVLQDLPLQDGDQIEVSRATVNDKEATQIASSSFAPDRITVNIVGEVKGAGPIAVKPNTPMNQALLAAGGFNEQAKRKTVTLVRLENNGTVSKRQIAVNFSEGLNDQTNPALRSGDTVIVEKSGIAQAGSTLGILTNPISGVLGLLRLFGIFR